MTEITERTSIPLRRQTLVLVLFLFGLPSWANAYSETHFSRRSATHRNHCYQQRPAVVSFQRRGLARPKKSLPRKLPASWPWPIKTTVFLSGDDDEVEEQEDAFDGAGFANYLGPYALALVGSIAVTALVFKFVFLDY